MTRKDAKRNRHHILEVFEVLVRNNPSMPPTMSDVVRVSGLGRGTVYRHFPDIGSLAFETLNDSYQSLFGSFRNDLSALDGAYDRIDDSLIQFLEACQAFAQDHRVLILTPECQSSMAYAKAKQSLRQLITESLARQPGLVKDREILKIRADLIARCVEAEHLCDSGAISTRTPESIKLAKVIISLSGT